MSKRDRSFRVVPCAWCRLQTIDTNGNRYCSRECERQHKLFLFDRKAKRDAKRNPLPGQLLLPFSE